MSCDSSQIGRPCPKKELLSRFACDLRSASPAVWLALVADIDILDLGKKTFSRLTKPTAGSFPYMENIYI
jgi:hypothetical protein